MGSATIKSNLGEGQYTIELTKSQAALTTRRANIVTRQGEVDAAIAALETELTALQAVKDEKYTALKDAIGVYSLLESPTADDRKKVTDAEAAYMTAQANVTKKQKEINLKKLEKISLAKKLTQIDDAMVVETKTAWCADYSTELTGTVGTLEVNGEDNQILVMPGGKTGLGLLQHPLAMTPSGVFVNSAKLPGWQKWKPTYRIGVLVLIDYDDKKCDVAIPEPYSSSTLLAINQEGEAYDLIQAEVSGWDDYASRFPDDPLVKNTDSTRLPETSTLLADLENVNQYVNWNYTYRTDSEQYGTLEHWSIMDPGGQGDCEDFALTKAKMLLDKGYPASALHIEVGLTPSGEGHAWLVVQTEGGDYALDIRYWNVTPNSKTNYTNRKRQTGKIWGQSAVLLKDVAMDYMDGAEHLFEIDDRVVVEFTNQDWDKPKVIGFESYPRSLSDILIHEVRMYQELSERKWTLSRVSLARPSEGYVTTNKWTIEQQITDYSVEWGAFGFRFLGYLVSVKKIVGFYDDYDTENRYMLWMKIIDENGNPGGHYKILNYGYRGFGHFARADGDNVTYIFMGSTMINITKDGTDITSVYCPFSNFDDYGNVIIFSNGDFLWAQRSYSEPYTLTIKYTRGNSVISTFSPDTDVIKIDSITECGDGLCYGIRKGVSVVTENTELRYCPDKYKPDEYTILRYGDHCTGTDTPAAERFVDLFYDRMRKYLFVGTDYANRGWWSTPSPSHFIVYSLDTMSVVEEIERNYLYTIDYKFAALYRS